MSRTATKEQDARARAREARLTLLADRNAQDERIEAAVAAALLAWEDHTTAAGKVEDAERDTAAGLALLRREKVSVRDMATLTGIGESVCSRLLKMPAADEPANGSMTSTPRRRQLTSRHTRPRSLGDEREPVRANAQRMLNLW
jgi:hypothetical protein